MGMSIKLDEDLSQLVAQPFLSRGYAVRTVRDQGWGGLKDPQLWPKVAAEMVFFVTADKGFGDIRQFPPGTHEGILVLRPDKESIVEYRAMAEAVLNKHAIEELRGCVTVVTPRSIRTRRPPG